MNFLFPAAFFLGLLGVGIVALYLQRPRRRSLEVSSLMFWRRVLEREPHRSFLGHLRRPLSLLAQLLILLALILALARPAAESGAQGRHTVVVVDARARMQAHGGDTFQRAVAAAQGIVSGASVTSPVAVLAVQGAPVIVSGFSDDPLQLRSRLGALQATDASGGMEETLALADRLLAAQRGETRLVVVTDRPIAGKADQILTGTAADNAALLALAQKPLPASPQSAEVFVKLGNFSREPRTLELELALDDRIFDLRSFTVPAGGERDHVAVVPGDMPGAGAGALSARLTGADALPADDAAAVMLAPGRPVRVLWLGTDNPFLEGALKADPGIAVDILSPENWKPSLAGSFDVVVFDQFVPENLDLESGRFFFFGKSPFDAPGDPVPVNEPEVADRLHPVLWNVKDIGPTRSRLLHSPPGWRAGAPVTGGGAPVILTLENPGGIRHVATSFGAGDSVFPLRAGFPLFVSNTLRWLAGRERSDDGTSTTGQTYRPKKDEKIAQTARKIPAAAAGEPPSLTGMPVRLDRKGFYELRSGTNTRWLAANLSSREESDLRGAQSSPAPALLASAPGGLAPWQWIALLALGLVCVEWGLHHRRVTE